MRDIKGYEGLYAVTSCGKVWSYRRQRFLKPNIAGNNYLYVTLCKNGEHKHCRIHRLVLETYNPVEGMENLQVNHLDENKNNNCINNLEWLTPKENINYGTGIERRKKTQSKPIYCVELDKTFESINVAARELGLNSGGICSCCKGRLKSTGGYHFRYAE